ncbi:protein phosphatase CheZ [Tepidicaulis sp. LMO-SS28]|uniref:protein phosphatase CheZ n=1 Tax=Tepidicaulis sp. LMO-SS28 TaxID=3447455 RepID=UPI003EDF6EAD
MVKTARLADQTFETLVAELKNISPDKAGLADIIRLAEIMVGSMQGFFAHLDTAIYKELTEISRFIDNAKSEISRLQPSNLQSTHIPQAGRELEAIVQATEEATNSIMENAETVLGADPSDADAYAETVNTAMMEIIQSCSFQDITGQRISKVVETLSFIEQKIAALSVSLGSAIDERAASETETDAERRKRELLLNGPALKGEGIDQNDVDRLLNEGSGASQEDIDSLFD